MILKMSTSKKKKKKDLTHCFVQMFQRKVLNNIPPFSGRVPNSSRLEKFTRSYTGGEKVAEMSGYVHLSLCMNASVRVCSYTNVCEEEAHCVAIKGFNLSGRLLL